jgi:Mg2+/Co2+ transporter CorB
VVPKKIKAKHTENIKKELNSMKNVGLKVFAPIEVSLSEVVSVVLFIFGVV